jgi:AcrR family transcriptional regulator
MTQERILDAAEVLFARQGVSATSLRSITTRAGVNAAAIHYHFGSKQALVSTILTRRIAPLSQERLKRLEQLEIRYCDEAIPAQLLVEAFVVPFATAGNELRDEIARLGSLLAWLRVEGDGQARSLASPAVDVNERFAVALCRRRSLELEEARDRFLYATGSVVQLLRQEPERENSTPTAEDLEALRGRLSRLIRFLAAGLAAPGDDTISISTHTQDKAASLAREICT